MIFPSLLDFLSWKGTHVGLSAAVERGPSQGARSASKEGTWPLPAFAVVLKPPKALAWVVIVEDGPAFIRIL
jgi:hypothetical protein